MKRIATTITAIALWMGVFGQSTIPCDELFISEMIEGTGMNKALEIFNPTDFDIDLSDFDIRIFHNGQLTPIVIALSGTIASKETFVITHPAADNNITINADMMSTEMNFDGNDAIVLEKGGGGNFVDKMGEIGVNPGPGGWACTSGMTKDQTLRRKYPVRGGEMDWQECRKQWDHYPKDNSSNLRSHSNVCKCILDTNVAYAPSGDPIYMANQLIVRFDTAAVKRDAIDNFTGKKSLECADVNHYIKDYAVTALNQQLADLCDTAQGAITMRKIFRDLKTTNTSTISRLGETIPIPAFWATFIFSFPDGTDISKVADSLNALFPLVKYAHPNVIVRLFGSADDTEYPVQTSLHATSFSDSAHINIEPAWDYEVGKPFVRVGIFDSGIDWEHEDFGDGTASGSKIVDGWEYRDNLPLKLTPTPDSLGHGTRVAGILGAIRNNNLGIAGIAGGNDIGASDLSDKGVALYSMGIFYLEPYSNPINYIAEAIVTSSIEDTSIYTAFGFHIMNHSWGFNELSFGGAYFNDSNITLMREAVHFANRLQVTQVAARGNDGPQPLQEIPATLDDDWVLCVGGTGTDGEFIHTGSNQNGSFTAQTALDMEIDIAAPAANLHVITTLKGGGYYNFNGTSAAAPHVSGVAALLMSYLNKPDTSYDNLAPEDVEAILQMSAKDNNLAYYSLPGVDSLSGHGLLDAGAAFQLVDQEFKRVSHYGTKFFPTTKKYTLWSPIAKTINIPERYKNEAKVWFAKGQYSVIAYQIDATVSHNLPTSDSIVAYWPRPSSSNLLPLFDSNDKLLPRERIAIDSLDQNYAYLRGYVYQVKDLLGNPLGWWPFDTAFQVQLEYTILRHNPSFTVGVKDVPNKSSWVTLYPNPTNHHQTIRINSDKAQNLEITLIDLMGRRIKTVYRGRSIAGNNSITSDVSALPLAIYFYEVKLGNEITHIRFVKH